MNGNERFTPQDFDPETAPDLSAGEWPAKFARARVRRGRPPLATPKVSTTIRLSPDVLAHFKADGRGWQTRINAALREWIRTYTKALELNPPLAETYTNRGAVKGHLGQHEVALADYDQALAAAYNNRGRAKHDLGQPVAALADYDRALALNPTHVAAYNNRAAANVSLGQPAVALADYDRAIELDPTHATAYYNRGTAKVSLGRISEARADYQQALTLAQEAGNEKLATAVRRNLNRLSTNAVP